MDGRAVVVKVQHKGVDVLMTQDMENLQYVSLKHDIKKSLLGGVYSLMTQSISSTLTQGNAHSLICAPRATPITADVPLM